MASSAAVGGGGEPLIITAEWVEQWYRAHHVCPWWLAVSIDHPLRAGGLVSVIATPWSALRDRRGCKQDPHFARGYEVPRALLHERLTNETAGWLKRALSAIQATARLSQEDSLAWLVHTYTLIWEFYQETIRGEPILARSKTYTELLEVFAGDVDTAQKAIELDRTDGFFDLVELPPFWRRLLREMRGDIVTHAGSPDGMVHYAAIPPVIVPGNQHEQLPAYGTEPPMVEATVDADYAAVAQPWRWTRVPMRQQLPALIHGWPMAPLAPTDNTLDERPGDQSMPVRGSSASSQEQHKEATAETARPQPIDFQHSNDYQSVSLNGQQFTLTERQAQVVKMLHHAYLQGFPDVAQTYILEELMLGSRLRDTFRTSMKAWKTLTTPGERRGTRRLNL